MHGGTALLGHGRLALSPRVVAHKRRARAEIVAIDRGNGGDAVVSPGEGHEARDSRCRAQTGRYRGWQARGAAVGRGRVRPVGRHQARDLTRVRPTRLKAAGRAPRCPDPLLAGVHRRAVPAPQQGNARSPPFLNDRGHIARAYTVRSARPGVDCAFSGAVFPARNRGVKSGALESDERGRGDDTEPEGRCRSRAPAALPTVWPLPDAEASTWTGVCGRGRGWEVRGYARRPIGSRRGAALNGPQGAWSPAGAGNAVVPTPRWSEWQCSRGDPS